MIKQGIPQKDIAKHFGVSCPAICKRLKRLSPQPEVILDKHNLTDKEKAFVIEKTKGKTNTQAVLSSYEVSSMESAKVIGSQLMAKPEVKMAIDELMEQHGLTRSYRVQRIKHHVDHADPNVSLKALDMTFKLDGSYAPERHAVANFSISEILSKVHQTLFSEEQKEPEKNGDG